MSTALAGRFNDLLQSVQRFDLAEADVLAGRQVIAHEILKDHADSLPEVEGVQLSDVDAVDQYRAFGGIVKAAQELDQRCLAGAVGSH